MIGVDSAHVSPVKRGEFSYDCISGLSVDRFPCWPCGELYALLTWKSNGPVLRKDGKPKVHQPKYREKSDQFYRAQCVHYGLKPFKSKAAAKKELLRAFGASKMLNVPQSIRGIEKELELEYATANAIAKKEREQERLVQTELETKRQLKRKREDEQVLQTISDAGKKKTKSSAKQRLDLDKVAAQYTVVSEYLRDNYGQDDDDDEHSLALAPSSSGGDVWGTFDFGSFDGYMRSTSIDPAARTITFNWRGRENGEGQSTFGEGNIIRITFLDDKTFEGMAEGSMFERCAIAGRYDVDASRNVAFHRSVDGWKYQYESLNEDNHERESRARWH